MTWRIQREDVELFRRELWKDERPFASDGRVGPDEFVKDCLDPRRQAVELNAIAALSAIPGEPLCPVARPLGDTHIALRKIEGIRLFDLIRLLRILELQNRRGDAASAIQTLLHRQRDRLSRIQNTLLAVKADLAADAYPMETKLDALLYLLSRIFGIEERFRQCRSDISVFSEYWRLNCSLIPFRDATTKNTLLEDPRLSPQKYGEEADRLAAVQAILSEESDYWRVVPLWDVDFSSVEHLTTPEDDPISLHCHEWTDGSCGYAAENYILLSSSFDVDPFRSAATLLVRYLRFGGRKLAYRIINSQGFEVRYRFDDPLFYFRSASVKCRTLSESFAAQFSTLLALVDEIGVRASHPSPADEGLLRVDHFRKFNDERAAYYQENPGERDGIDGPASSRE